MVLPVFENASSSLLCAATKELHAVARRKPGVFFFKDCSILCHLYLYYCWLLLPWMCYYVRARIVRV